MASRITIAPNASYDDVKISYSAEWHDLPPVVKMDCLQSALCELENKYEEARKDFRKQSKYKKDNL